MSQPSTLIVYHDDGTPERITCANGFVSRCVSAIAEHNIQDAIKAARILNAGASSSNGEVGR